MSLALARNRALVSRLFDVDNLHRRIEASSSEERSAGLYWYRAAHDEALDLARCHGITVEAAAGVIAALSPQLAWDLNVRYAREHIETGRSGHFALCEDRAAAILRTPGTDDDVLSILGGPKVRSFYRNIARPHQAGPVTVDRHACAVLHGTATPVFLRQHAKVLERKAVYRLVAGIYRTAAREYDLLPHELQAIAWVSHRNAQDLGQF